MEQVEKCREIFNALKKTGLDIVEAIKTNNWFSNSIIILNFVAFFVMLFTKHYFDGIINLCCVFFMIVSAHSVLMARRVNEDTVRLLKLCKEYV